MKITYLHPRGEDFVGMIPAFLHFLDPRPAAEQFDEKYAFGGGWRPMEGWTTEKFSDTNTLGIKYPGDPVLLPVARINFREEVVWVYAHAWVAIEQPDGRVEISRMD
jgi:hypothetical protein